ncbi:MAG: DUF4215 domain-containing protein [Polyangiaceae bacterium]|nr:DUF4215 domain-containing protein [Polyangiaceae bacterium]
MVGVRHCALIIGLLVVGSPGCGKGGGGGTRQNTSGAGGESGVADSPGKGGSTGAGRDTVGDSGEAGTTSAGGQALSPGGRGGNAGPTGEEGGTAGTSAEDGGTAGEPVQLINECYRDLHDCSPDATCEDTRDGYTCTCNSGYEGDGRTCTDIDECATGTHDCDPNATCFNMVGFFRCTCNEGYLRDNDDDKVCVVRCGDGIVLEDEECDDGNTYSGDGCSRSCKKECGDGVVVLPGSIQLGFSIFDCGEGAKGSARIALNGVPVTVTAGICTCGTGTLMINDHEDRDDLAFLGALRHSDNVVTLSAGGYIYFSWVRLTIGYPDGESERVVAFDWMHSLSLGPADECEAKWGKATGKPFALPSPGYFEECDDGNTIDGDGCSSTCVLEPLCGDALVTGPEECDDGNTHPGDGCSDTCTLEPDWVCGDRPSVCVQGWTCDTAHYDAADGCQCGCGVVDPDCIDDLASNCDDCNTEGSCNLEGYGCPGIIEYDNNAVCD